MARKIQYRQEAFRLRYLAAALVKRNKIRHDINPDREYVAPEERVAEVKGIIERIGWPTCEKVGLVSARALHTFLFETNGHPDFMAYCWEKISELPSGQVRPELVELVRSKMIVTKVAQVGTQAAPDQSRPLYRRRRIPGSSWVGQLFRGQPIKAS
jgi:hypothetical protein